MMSKFDEKLNFQNLILKGFFDNFIMSLRSNSSAKRRDMHLQRNMIFSVF